MTGTVRLHRVLRAKPEKIYRAFVDAEALARWLPPNGFICTVDHVDARVGGTFRMAFRNFTTGSALAFGGAYLELVPGERIRYTNRFDSPGPSGEMITTVSLKGALPGADVEIVQEGIPESIPVEFCYLGWQESLEYLARLVEPEIPDAPSA
jgi:uncharacterized protein YndB with AHSA1/START domain